MSLSDSPRRNDAVLTVSELSVSLRVAGGETAALRDVSFAIEADQRLAVLGEPGAGLQPLLDAIAGLTDPRAKPRIGGTIGLDRRRMAVVFRDHPLAIDPSRRLRDQFRLVRQGAAAMGRLLALAGLPEDVVTPAAYPAQLTPAQRQRLSLALALGQSPSLLILEEPGAGLDAPERAGLLQTIAGLDREAASAMLILTERPETVAALATHCAVMSGGRLVEIGEAPAVLKRPAHPLTEAALTLLSPLRAERGRRLVPVIAERPIPGGLGKGCAFRGPCPAGSTRCIDAPPLADAWHGGKVACWHVAAASRRGETPPRWPLLTPSGITPALRLEQIAYRFPPGPGYPGGRPWALEDITLKLGDHEAVAIVGTAGAGKSTLLRIAAGLLKPAEGRRAQPADVLPQMLAADARASLPPWRSVAAIVGERLRRDLSPAERATRIEEAIVLVQLPPEVARLRPAALTPAQAQRVALARAIATPPGILLCDDVLSGLDSRAAASLLNLLAGLRRSQRFAMLFATGDLAAARYLTDRIIVLSEGRIEEEGPVEQVISAPAGPTAKRLRALALARDGLRPGAAA